MNRTRKTVIILVLSFLIPVFLFSEGLAWEDWPDSRPDAVPTKVQTNVNIGQWLASFYRDHISPVDGSRCPSMPSCSSYSIQAFQKHGFFKGWIMTVDRLLHEGEEGRFSPLIYTDGEWKIFDPVENNDFWWFHEDEADSK